ncbi:alcohol dehydrogenase, partial [Methylobacterium trifolii]
ACARAMGVARDGEGDEGAVARLVTELERLNDDLDVPGPREYGLDAGRWAALIPTMAAQALASGSPGNNPLVPNTEEIEALYRRVWEA